ncbi:transglutaminase family protein [Curtobacterium ammoniigenes]|uniref:transglutaminase family protein n=1 Tax=Curtobacterium ammoniigenes TaxID=395387 RepID=UPI0012EE4157|nr:transglutaminase domain-containing protein [Curtobacterium ammoniigenes]
MTWLLVAIASVAWWPIYDTRAMLVAGAGAMVLGGAVAIVGALFRLGAAPVGLLAAAGFAAVGVPLAIPSESTGALPSVAGLTALFSAIALSWKQLLTVPLPVGSYETLLVPYFLLVLVSTVVGVSVATRTRRPELGALPAVVLFIVGVGFGATRLAFPVLAGVALMGVALTWALASRHLRRARVVAQTIGAPLRPGRSVVRPTLLGVTTILIAAAVAFGAGAIVPPAPSRHVLRSAVVKQFDPSAYVSPLSGFRAYEEAPAVDAPQLRITGLPPDSFIRIATLDTYDGVVYGVGGPSGSTASGTFERIPTSVDVNGVSGRHVSVDVTVSGYRGVWLPTVGDLESISFTGSHGASASRNFFYNPTTQTGAILGGVQGGTSYRLSAVVPNAPGAGAVGAMHPGTAHVPTPSNVPAAVTSTVASVAKAGSSPGAKLSAVLQWLRSNGYVSHGVGNDRPSASGHGANRIQQLLTSVPMVGDAEQYAVAASLMAQSIGFPARVVMGFSTTPSADGSATVVGADITARIEVNTREQGWVMLDPNPPLRPIPAAQEQQPKPITRPETIVPPPPAQQTHQNTQNPESANRSSPPVEPQWLRILRALLPWVIGSASGLGILIAPLLVILLIKTIRRRRRRRSGSGRTRIVAAWDEYRDRLLDAGYTLPARSTRREVAAATRAPHASGLAALADRAVFGPSDVDGMTADRMWAETDRAIAELTGDRTRWERIRMRLSLRSLRGRASARSNAARRADYDVREQRA